MVKYFNYVDKNGEIL